MNADVVMMRLEWKAAPSIVAAIVAFGAARRAAAQEGPNRQPERAAPTSTCPMAVPGTRVAVADTKGGVALAFSTATGNVAEVRSSATRMADRINRHAVAGGSCCGGAGTPVTMGRGGMMHRRGMGMGMRGTTILPDASATTVDTRDGARVELTPADPAQLDALRSGARAWSSRVQSGQCPMMQMQGGTSGATSPTR